MSEIETPIEQKKEDYLLGFILLGLFILTSILVFFVYRSFFWTSFIALIFYMASRDYYMRLKRRLGLRFKPLAPWLMIILVLVIIVVPSFFILRTLVSEFLGFLFILKVNLSEDKILLRLLNTPFFTDLVTDTEFFWIQFPAIYRDIVGSYGDILNIDSIYGIVSNAATLILGGIRLPVGILINFFFGFLLIFFFYKDGYKLESFLLSILPFSEEIKDKIGIRIADALKTIVKGNLFISFLQGLAVGLILFFLGIPSPVLYGSIAAIFSLIPIVGTMVVWLPAGLYLGIFENNWVSALILMSLSFSFYLIFENLLKPSILDKKLKIHPFLLFLALLGGLKEFGILGVILGPAAVTLIVILWDFWLSYKITHSTREILRLIGFKKEA